MMKTSVLRGGVMLTLAMVLATAGVACDDEDETVVAGAGGAGGGARAGGSGGSVPGSGGGTSGSGGSTIGDAATGSDTGGASSDIVATAIAAGTFKTLVAAVQAAELVDTLKGPGPFTVFAPTDAAFAKLPAGTVDTLLQPGNRAALQALLKYHLVAGRVLAADVVKLTRAATVEGREVKIVANGGMVKVNDANVVATDIAASNGVIHVIDTVLIPPM